jgi:hypothetical protein
MGSVKRFRIVALIAASILATSAFATDKHRPAGNGGGNANAIANSVSHGGDASAAGGAGGQGGSADARAAGGAGGSASATQTQTASGGAGGAGGDASNVGNAQDVSVSSTYRERLQAPSVSAPAVYASGPCTSGWSAGIAIPGGGLSGGKGKPDPGCERRELARVLTPLAPDLALRLLCADPMLAAVVSADECLFVPQPLVTTNGKEYATREELEQVRKDSATAIDRAFKQRQTK